MDENVSSLSAILLDDDDYALIRNGRVKMDDIAVLDVAYLILFKMKVWLDLSSRKAVGENVDSKNIRKHKNDGFRLSQMLGKNVKIVVSPRVNQDIQRFIAAMRKENIDTKQLGLARNKDSVLDAFQDTYVL